MAVGCCQLPARATLPPLQEHTRTRPPLPTAAALSCSGLAVPWLPWQIRALERGGGQGCPSAPLFVPQLGLISPCSLWFIGFRFTFRVVSRHHHRAALGCLLRAFAFGFWPSFFPSPFLPPLSPLFVPSSSFRQHCPGPVQGADPDQACQELQDAPAAPTHPSFHPQSVLRQLQTSLQNLLYHQGTASPHLHVSLAGKATLPLPFAPVPNHSKPPFCLFPAIPSPVGRDFPCRCGTAPWPCPGKVAQPREFSGWLGCPRDPPRALNSRLPKSSTLLFSRNLMQTSPFKSRAAVRG